MESFSDLFDFNNLDPNSDPLSMCEVSFDLTHPVFEAHFPGQPIVPGAYLIYIFKTLIKHRLNKNIIIREIPQIKYIAPIDPKVTPTVLVQMKITTKNERPYAKIDLRSQESELLTKAEFYYEYHNE
jgi:3-hydroxyacyl-[acyl-carrier-protein] dehydratase